MVSWKISAFALKRNVYFICPVPFVSGFCWLRELNGACEYHVYCSHLKSINLLSQWLVAMKKEDHEKKTRFWVVSTLFFIFFSPQLLFMTRIQLSRYQDWQHWLGQKLDKIENYPEMLFKFSDVMVSIEILPRCVIKLCVFVYIEEEHFFQHCLEKQMTNKLKQFLKSKTLSKSISLFSQMKRKPSFKPDHFEWIFKYSFRLMRMEMYHGYSNGFNLHKTLHF